MRVIALDRVPRSSSGEVDLDALTAALWPCDLLETAPGHPGWSYLVPHTGDRLVDDGTTTRWLRADGSVTLVGTDPFAAVDAWAEHHGVLPHGAVDPGLPPFTGGLVGAFGYGLGRRIERVPTLAVADRPACDLSLRVAEVVVAVAPDRDRVLLVARPLADASAATSPGAGAGERRVDALVATVVERIASAPAEVAPTEPPRQPVRVTTSLPRAPYLTAVAAVKEAIAAGDAFQVNLTQRLTAWTDLPTDVLYRRLRAASPAPHCAVLPDIGVASISPETFFKVTDGTVVCRPIKGTRPRDDDPDLDAAHADDLSTSAKDRAENVMIVDLTRNDLGRVCVPASVQVPRLCAVEAHPTVWHLVSDVVGQLRPDAGYGDLLRATFPCGSITGTPKIAAMGLIERLEPVQRGWYCGAVGFLSPGAASLSVAIRTATRQPGGRVDHGAGGGIVADSDPEAEHAESLAKAAAFLRAVDGVLVDRTQ